MTIYRGCVFSIFGCFLASLSVALGAAVGLLGLVLPSFLVLTVYVFLESLIIELLYLGDGADHDR